MRLDGFSPARVGVANDKGRTRVAPSHSGLTPLPDKTGGTAGCLAATLPGRVGRRGYLRFVNTGHDAVERLRNAVAELRPGKDTPPAEVRAWDEMLRITLDGWAAALQRDVRRAADSLSAATDAEGSEPTDDEIAALEECLWRLAAATEKIDAIISLAFGGDPFVVVADKPTGMTMRPSRDRNTATLKEIGSEGALQLAEARASLASERSRLRRHQLMHSLAPIDALADLGVFIRVHHRDGRIFGYELLRWSPERWDEGINALTSEALFAQRIKEARRGLEAVLRVIDATSAALEEEPVARVPQYVYYDHDTGMLSAERPSPTGPPKSFEVDFVVDEADPPVSRRVSCTSLMFPGIEIAFDDGLWRVIRVEDGRDGAHQRAICRVMEESD